jgi:hypothetical protein
MASKIVLMTALFDQVSNFADELSQMYPDDPDFAILMTALKLMKSTNPSMLAKTIYESAIKYEDQILGHDEEFFLNSEFEEYKEDGMDIIAKMKQYYSLMDLKSKDNVWKYCQNIIRLSKAVQVSA